MNQYNGRDIELKCISTHDRSKPCSVIADGGLCQIDDDEVIHWRCPDYRWVYVDDGTVCEEVK